MYIIYRSQPALLGRKVVQRYYRGDNYMEIDVYVGSSVIASQIVSICRGYGKHFTCNIGMLWGCMNLDWLIMFIYI